MKEVYQAFWVLGIQFAIDWSKRVNIVRDGFSPLG